MDDARLIQLTHDIGHKMEKDIFRDVKSAVELWSMDVDMKDRHSRTALLYLLVQGMSATLMATSAMFNTSTEEKWEDTLMFCALMAYANTQAVRRITNFDRPTTVEDVRPTVGDVFRWSREQAERILGRKITSVSFE